MQAALRVEDTEGAAFSDGVMMRPARGTFGPTGTSCVHHTARSGVVHQQRAVVAACHENAAREECHVLRRRARGGTGTIRARRQRSCSPRHQSATRPSAQSRRRERRSRGARPCGLGRSGSRTSTIASSATPCRARPTACVVARKREVARPLPQLQARDDLASHDVDRRELDRRVGDEGVAAVRCRSRVARLPKPSITCLISSRDHAHLADRGVCDHRCLPHPLDAAWPGPGLDPPLRSPSRSTKRRATRGRR
jgi:hypothetical protein